jgi:tetratricopeptide (TPR) repeat protein
MHEGKGPIVISGSFSERGRRHIEELSKFLEVLGLTAVRGEFLGGAPVSKGVQELLSAAWFVVVILSREERIDDDTWRGSDWVMQEAAWAKALGKECVFLLERGVQFHTGLLGDVERIAFSDDYFSEVFVPFGKQLRSLLNRSLLTLGVMRMPVHTHVSDEPLDEGCSDEANQLILDIRYLARQQRYEEAFELAMKATKADPNCWRAWTSLGALMVRLGKLDDGDKVFAQVLKRFPNDRKGAAAALHNRAWVLEIRGGPNPTASNLREQSRLYEKVLELDDSRVNTRASLLICKLLLSEAEEAERILADSRWREGFLDALRFELDARGIGDVRLPQALPKWLRTLLQALPKWLRKLLYSNQPNDLDDDV